MLLRPSRRKWILVLLGCSVFVFLGVTLVPRSDPMFWVTSIFFGLCGLIGLVKLLSPSEYLRISADGFEEHVLFRHTRVEWKDVERFVPSKVATTAMVGIVFRESYTRQARMRRFARSFAGMQGALSDTYGLSAEELADLLNQWRTKNSPSHG